MAAVLVGDDGPSQTYVNSKIKACERVGFESSLFKFQKSISEVDLINEIERSEWVDDKMIGCAAIILAGLSYQNKSGYLNFGLNLLKKIIKFG